jgi:hypothetical protein
MVKITDALVTVEDVNGMLQPIGSTPVSTNRVVVKDQNFVGASPGTVGVNNYWKVDTGVSPYSTYTNNRNPRYQDLIPLSYSCGDGIVQGGYAGVSQYTYPNQNITGTTTALVYLYWEVYERPNIISVYDSSGLRYTTGWVGYAAYSGPWGPSLNTSTTGTILVTFASTNGRYISVQAGPADPGNPLADGYSWSLSCVITTTTTTSTSSTTTTTTTLQSYDLYYPCGTTTPANLRVPYSGNLTPGDIILASNYLCYTVAGGTILGPPQLTVISEHSTCQDCQAAVPTTTTTTTCNPTPNWQNTGTYSCYSTCNKYEVEQDINPCSPTFGQTRQGTVVEYNTTYCGGCCGQSTAANWVSNGNAFCTGCTLYQPQIDNNPCSATYNNTRNEPAGTSNNCGTWNTSYYCVGCAYYSKETNTCTGDVRNVTLISGNSTSCGGCCGQSTSPNWQNVSFSCYGTCNKYNVEQDTNPCSSTYGQTQQGSLVETNSGFCYISGANCCGQSTGPNWVNDGPAFCSGCYLFQPQIDNNVCSSTYNQTQNVDLGVNSDCGAWPTVYYCVGYDYYSKEVNTCTGAERFITLVQANSPNCGYPVCRSYQIIGYNSDEYVSGTYTNCSGFPDSFSFYGGPGTVGYVCAQPSSVYITSGNGAANDVGSC